MCPSMQSLDVVWEKKIHVHLYILGVTLGSLVFLLFIPKFLMPDTYLWVPM